MSPEIGNRGSTKIGGGNRPEIGGCGSTGIGNHDSMEIGHG